MKKEEDDDDDDQMKKKETQQCKAQMQHLLFHKRPQNKIIQKSIHTSAIDRLLMLML